MQPQVQATKTAILLLAFGGPQCLDDVKPFLHNIFCGRPVSAYVEKEVRRRYQMIGGCSPLAAITEQQARSLENVLRTAGKKLPVSVAMRYWHPSIPEVLSSLQKKNVENVIYCIMSPFCTPAATGGYDEMVHNSARNLRVIPVPAWHAHPRFLDAVEEHIRKIREAFPPSERDNLPVLFTAHSLPVDTVRDDPYVSQLESTIAALQRRLKLPRACLGFQSPGKGRQPWLGPSAEDMVAHLAGNGFRNLLVVPLGFVADHLETLYDLDIVLKKRAEAHNMHLERTPSLNDSPLLIEAIADSILTVLTNDSQA